jgi:hypothetical protein
VTAPAVTQIDYEEPGTRGTTGLGKNQRKALEILQAETERHQQNIAQSGRDPDTARVSCDAWHAACLDAGMARNRASEAMAGLMNKGAVKVKDGYITSFST